MKNSDRVYADIGFDVLHDGEKHHRVEKGILFEFVNKDDLYVHVSPGDRTMFYEIFDCLLEMMDENEWKNDFMVWKLMKKVKGEENDETRKRKN